MLLGTANTSATNQLGLSCLSDLKRTVLGELDKVQLSAFLGV